MNEDWLYVRATSGRRFVAFLANLFILGILGFVFRFLDLDKGPHLSSVIAVLLILLCCLFPESPGKRLLNLKIVDEKKMPVGTKHRIYRATPYLLFFVIAADGVWFESQVGNIVRGIASMLTLMFLFANTLAVYFSPDDHSLLDMKLGTRVVMPRKLPGQESPKVMGIKVW